MFNKHYHRKVYGNFLWTAFIVNLILFGISLITGIYNIILLSILFSLVIIIIQHTNSNRRLYLSTGSSDTLQKVPEITVCDTFVKGSDLLRKQKYDAPKEQIKSKKNSFTSEITIGSSQCKSPFISKVLNIDIPKHTIYTNNSIINSELENTGSYCISFYDNNLAYLDLKNIILKFPVNKEIFSDPEKEIIRLCDKTFYHDNYKAIEIVMDTMFDTPYSLHEFYEKGKNAFFNNNSELLQFVLKLRRLSNGKPIGIRTGISSKIDIIELCKLMKNTGIIIDFITLSGEKCDKITTVYNQNKFLGYSPLSLEYRISATSKILKEYGLEKEIRIGALAEISNGKSFIKYLNLGASYCNAILSGEFQDENPKEVFRDEIKYITQSEINQFYKKITEEIFQN